jgi:branched-subunit amino acid transport protein
MTHEAWLWLTFLLMGVVSVLLRSSFIVFGRRLQLPPRIERSLLYAPPAALAAIVIPDVLLVEGELAPLSPKLLAAIVAAGTALASRNPWLPFLTGIAALLGIEYMS